LFKNIVAHVHRQAKRTKVHVASCLVLRTYITALNNKITKQHLSDAIFAQDKLLLSIEKNPPMRLRHPPWWR
jgi:hypothetical protein